MDAFYKLAFNPSKKPKRAQGPLHPGEVPSYVNKLSDMASDIAVDIGNIPKLDPKKFKNPEEYEKKSKFLIDYPMSGFNFRPIRKYKFLISRS